MKFTASRNRLEWALARNEVVVRKENGEIQWATRGVFHYSMEVATPLDFVDLYDSPFRREREPEDRDNDTFIADF